MLRPRKYPKPKKPYKKPELIVYGTVHDLRKRDGAHGTGECCR